MNLKNRKKLHKLLQVFYKILCTLNSIIPSSFTSRPLVSSPLFRALKQLLEEQVQWKTSQIFWEGINQQTGLQHKEEFFEVEWSGAVSSHKSWRGFVV